MIFTVLLLLFGFILLISGANILINSSVILAKKFNISELIIGLTIVAFGTSAPELSVSVISTIKNTGNIVIGNIIGSNILNIGLILGTAGLFYPLVIKKQISKFDLPVLLISSLLLPVFLANQYFSRWEGLLFIILFMIIILFWYKNRHAVTETPKSLHQHSNIVIILLILAGITGLAYGGELTVDSAIKIANKLNISPSVIALTIVALGTSLPEFVTSIVAMVKKKPDISIGNIVGSNIFNILLCLGISGLIKPFTLQYAKNQTISGINIYFTSLLLIFALFWKKLTRISSILLLASYLLYIYIIL